MNRLIFKAMLFLVVVLPLGCSKLKKAVGGAFKPDIGHLTPCQKEALVNSYLPKTMHGIYRNEECKQSKQSERNVKSVKAANVDLNADDLIDGSAHIDASSYTLAPQRAARDNGKDIDVNSENMRASHFLRSIRVNEHVKYKVLIVPGYSEEEQNTSVSLHENAIARLEIAKAIMDEASIPVILLTGGNVHPKGTPFNEAMEMKKYLMSKHGMPEYRIAVEPYARHSTTNLRNCGRFMRAHGVRQALIATTGGQNLYFGLQNQSTFWLRAEMTLGYSVGELKILTKNRTLFIPSKKVFVRGNDRLDP